MFNKSILAVALASVFAMTTTMTYADDEEKKETEKPQLISQSEEKEAEKPQLISDSEEKDAEKPQLAA